MRAVLTLLVTRLLEAVRAKKARVGPKAKPNVAGALAVNVTTAYMTFVGIAGLRGFDISGSLDNAETAGPSIVLLWSLLFVVGGVQVLLARLTRHDLTAARLECTATACMSIGLWSYVVTVVQLAGWLPEGAMIPFGLAAAAATNMMGRSGFIAWNLFLEWKVRTHG